MVCFFVDVEIEWVDVIGLMRKKCMESGAVMKKYKEHEVLCECVPDVLDVEDDCRVNYEPSLGICFLFFDFRCV